MKRRLTSYLAMISFVIGVAVLLIVTSVMGGFARDMKEKIRGTTSHIMVTKGLGKLIGDYQALMDEIDEIPHIKHSSPRIQWPVLWKSEMKRSNRLHFGILTGIDPQREIHTSRIQEFVADQQLKFSYQDGSDPSNFPILIGASPRPGKGLKPEYFASQQGMTLRLTSGKFVDQAELQDKFDVVGTYSSGLSEFDNKRMYCPLSSAQQFIGEPGYITHIAVKVDQFQNDQVLAQVQNNLRKVLNDHNRFASFRIKTWKQKRQSLLQAVKVERGLTAILLFLVVIVAAFMLLSVLSMMVMEKRKDIGIIRSLGGSSTGVASIFLLEGIIIGTLGTAIGFVLGLLVVWNLNPIADTIKQLTGWHPFPADVYLLEKIPADFDLQTGIVISLSSIAVSVLFSLIPAWKASTMNPIESIRYE